ncbi:MAG: UDP-N-acetylmuramoyl-L-alanyl-D-glutamate--2,6-diaminopimelate ligase [Ruminococcaceae bacterium]|nr:UDP-N-acetylmuramoyl-L-alanyl-D-glutamate--2,6-diaminopimelate ligase [Oscillospiraceae bacterium]
MKLSRILENLKFEILKSGVGNDVNVLDIVYDSRKATKDTLFVCLVGFTTDGHKYAKNAYESGCRLFMVEKPIDVGTDATVIKVANTRAALAHISANFFEHPSKKLKLIGVTGTKGKTTTTHIIKHVLDSVGIKTGLIGTVGATWGNKNIETINTTPESYEIQKILAEMVCDDIEIVAVEVSSLGVKHNRIDALEFYCGIFTNISKDHIGGLEHENFEEYYFWKKEFFNRCNTAIACIDDPSAINMVSAVKGEKLYYGLSKSATVKASSFTQTKSADFLGVIFDFSIENKSYKNYEISLPGKYSVLNALASISVLHLLGIDIETARSGFKTISVKGRAEIVYMDENFSIIIDYAHNGTSFENLVKTMKGYNPKRIISLFGTVGGRAQNRREELGRLSARISDFTIITEDEPNFEPAMQICDEIESFLLLENPNAKYVKIADRGNAILFGIEMLEPGDMLLLCGKGHETTMLRNGVHMPFKEIDYVREGLKRRNITTGIRE